MIAYPPGKSGVGSNQIPSGSNLLPDRSTQICVRLVLEYEPCLAYFIYPEKTAISPGIMRVSLGVIAISSGEISIHFQFISSGINRISADIISISAYRNNIPAYRKAVPVLFYVALFCIFALCGQQDLHKKCKKHIPPIKKKGIKKNAPPAHGCALCSYYARYSNN